MPNQNRGFAKRIYVKITLRETDNTNSYSQKRAEVQAEINSLHSKVKINRREFQKTQAEKDALKIEKAKWKEEFRRRGY